MDRDAAVARLTSVHDHVQPRRVADHIRDHALASRGFPLATLDDTPQRLDDFDAAVHARLDMGAWRYGPLSRTTRRHVVDYVRHKLGLYEFTGNLEALVDAAALCQVEYVAAHRGIGAHPRPHWTPDGGDGAHCLEDRS